ncbi:uncharacterized protein BJ171DRAFT_623749 [Polychytrium aggregatum]|uniref:uncharacterized protein n=1 Tax=Polychytrium aggregatum TaxID=110093 RepID=UPI0022FE4223|nr:uncharacterized protein BJ171DRAFT_623749 [Polychytrium aggregatum]KAI9203464.1 hypothetical protein BJ171DRAFT_623749 [Polychytrium aggregatum]
MTTPRHSLTQLEEHQRPSVAERLAQAAERRRTLEMEREARLKQDLSHHDSKVSLRESSTSLPDERASQVKLNSPERIKAVLERKQTLEEQALEHAERLAEKTRTRIEEAGQRHDRAVQEKAEVAHQANQEIEDVIRRASTARLTESIAKPRASIPTAPPQSPDLDGRRTSLVHTEAVQARKSEIDAISQADIALQMHKLENKAVSASDLHGSSIEHIRSNAHKAIESVEMGHTRHLLREKIRESQILQQAHETDLKIERAQAMKRDSIERIKEKQAQLQRSSVTRSSTSVDRRDSTNAPTM